jgi:ankyrin repeat protein
MLASRYGHESIVKLLLSNGADVNMQNKWEATALLYASTWRHMAIAELLLESAADAETSTKVTDSYICVISPSLNRVLFTCLDVSVWNEGV